MVLKKIGCRIFQGAFRLAIPFLPYREPEILASTEDLGNVFSRCKEASVLIVTSGGSAKRGFLASAKKALEERNIPYAIYDKTKPNPTVENVEEGLAIYQRNGCDTILAIGGGSVMDCAKAIGARVAYPKKGLDKLAGVMKVLRKIPTLIAVPTTAGTGSETTLAAVITDEKSHHKYAVMSFPLIPNVAVLDPEMTCLLPPHLTAATGMDALTHAVEAYIGRSTTKKTRHLAKEAVKLIFENLESAYLDGQNKEARKNMLLAAYKAGVAFSVSYVGYVHALAHALGGKYDSSHGLSCAVLLPHLLEGYGKKVHKKLFELALFAGLCSQEDSEEAGAKKFIQAVKDLNSAMKIEPHLPELRKEDIPSLAVSAEKEANPLYPVPKIFSARELEAFYEKIAPSH